MALFSMRDSWNVWRRKVNEALGGITEPVKAKNVTYSGTSSGLSATNVQGAIDEVEGRVDTAESDISGLKGFNTDIPNGYLYMGTAKISDTVENGTFSSVLDTIATHLKTDIQAIADDEIVIPVAIVVVGNAFLTIRYSAYDNAVTNVALVGSTVSGSSSTMLMWSCIAESSSTPSSISHMQYQSNAWTFTNDAPNSTGASKTVECYYHKFKKIK